MRIRSTEVASPQRLTRSQAPAQGPATRPARPAGWVAGPVKVTATSSPPTAPAMPTTVAGVLEALSAVGRRTDLSAAEREASVDRLTRQAEALGVGGDNPFAPLLDKAVVEALRLPRHHALTWTMGRAAGRKLDRAAHVLPPPMPAVPGRISTSTDWRNPGGAMALLSAQVVTGAYGANTERIRTMMSAQFDTSRVVDGGPLGARALVGTRTDSPPMTMIGFRGTNNLVDAARDVMMGCLTVGQRGPCFKLKDGATYGGGAVHAGFAEHLDTVWPSIKKEMLEAARAGRTVEITGHSLGAATAQLAMARALNDPQVVAALKASPATPKAMLVTFAQPSVGDAAFERSFKSRLDGLGIPFHTYGFRNDPVIQVPPIGLPDVDGRTFARPSAEFFQLDSTSAGATLTRGRPPELVKQHMRTDLAGFSADAFRFGASATRDAQGYSVLADHAPQNYWGALRELTAPRPR